MSIVVSIIVPRAIGPSDYGDFSYIVTTYTFLIQLFIFTSNLAYIYFLSHEKYLEEDINTFYFIFLFITSAVVVAVGLVAANTELGLKYLWNGLDDKYLLYLGMLFGLLASLQQRLIEFSDSTSQTVQSEKLKLISKFLLVLSVAGLIFFSVFDLPNYFLLSILSYLFFIYLFANSIKFSFGKIKKGVMIDISYSFYQYLKPLIGFTLVAATYSYMGKYVLQSSSGSIEQGYYNFAYQLAMIPVMFISSIMAIYLSEMTKKFQAGEIEVVKNIFLDNVFRIYAIHAFISFFIVVNAEEIILLVVGKSFLGATAALQALSIFSLLHALGMLSGNIFFSSGRNRQYSIINSIIMGAGIVYLSYILFDSNINAVGLALIMTGFYLLRVLLQLYMNMSYLKINKVDFLFELISVNLIIFLVVKVISAFGLFWNLFLSLSLLVVINFIFKDYVRLKQVIRRENGIG